MNSTGAGVEEDKLQQKADVGEINLIDLLMVLARHKKLIIGGTLGAGIVMAVISLIMTPVYQARTKIYIPRSSIILSAQLMDQLGLGGSMVDAGPAKTPNDLYMEIIRSRPACDHIIDRYGLMKVYGSETREDTGKALLENMDVKQDIKSGVITLKVKDPDPGRSAVIANAFVDELRSIARILTINEASQRRQFFDVQLKDAKGSLAEAEEAMKAFQEKTGAVRIDEQAAVVIEGMAQIKAQITAKEVWIRMMRAYSWAQNPDIKKAEEELRGMREQMQRLESKSSVIVPTGNFPSAGTEYLRHMRELKFNEMLYGLLMSQYEKARLNEVRDAVVVQVIEKAVPPEKRIKPRRPLMVIIGLFLGLLITIFTAFLVELYEQTVKDPEGPARMKTLMQRLSSGRENRKSAPPV
jgi:tyrosine-protein kinase Etk/Wzc